MDYKNKYLKYKLNCNLLKNKLNQIGGMIIKTIANTGSMEGMSNQCFWISIFNYLDEHVLNGLSLSILRGWAGLDSTTEHSMFDTDDESFRESIITLLLYIRKRFEINLKIKIYRADYKGNLISRANAFELNIEGTGLIDDRAASFDDNEGTIIRIANFGLGHFELITNIENDSLIELPATVIPKIQLSSKPTPSSKPSPSSKPPPFALHAMASSSVHLDDDNFVPRVLIGDKYIPL